MAVNDRRRRSLGVSIVWRKGHSEEGGISFKTGLLSYGVNEEGGFKGVGGLSCI